MRILTRAVGLLLILLLTVAVVAWLMIRSRINATPEWFEPHAASTPERRAEAQLVERTVTSRLTELRTPEDQWVLELSQDEANAWLAERLPRWLANREIDWPTGFGPVVMRMDAGVITLASTMAKPDGSERVVGVTVQPLVQGEQVMLMAETMHIGTLAVPGEMVASRLDTLLPPGILEPRAGMELGAILSGTSPIMDPAEFTLADERRVRLHAIEIDGTSLKLTCTTLAPAR